MTVFRNRTYNLREAIQNTIPCIIPEVFVNKSIQQYTETFFVAFLFFLINDSPLPSTPVIMS
jgi:uncharacterized membrane protein (DUF373 family)